MTPRSHALTRLGAAAALALTATGAAAAPAGAASATTAGVRLPAGVTIPSDVRLRPEPWLPWEQQEWVSPAGRNCDFTLALDVVEQDVRSRVLARHADGSVRLQEFAGPLVVDFVNADTGARTRHDAGGSGVAELWPSGGFKTFAMVGPVGAGFRDGDAFPKGYYVVDGFHVATYAADGRRALPVRVGTQTNVCHELG